MSESDELVKKYDLEPTPMSVTKLGELVSKRDRSIDEIINVISSDIALKSRLLRAANPSDGHLKIDSVQEAVLRTGVGCSLVLAMSDPLIKALTRTFMTMASVKLVPINPSNVGSMDETIYLGSARFDGKARGTVYIRIRESFAFEITSKMLELESPEEIAESAADVLGELVNMVVGSFKSNLCDAGLSCSLSLPTVERVQEFKAPPSSGGRHQVFAFKAGLQPVLLNILVDSTE